MPRLSRVVSGSSGDDLLWLAGDGAVAIASPPDGELTWIDVDTGRPTGLGHSTGRSVPDLKISDNGSAYATGPTGSGAWITPSGGPVRFATDPDAWRDIARETAGRELTAEEWRTLISDTELQVASCT